MGKSESSNLFVDADFFCALYNRKDSQHDKAKQLAARIASSKFSLVTSNLVLFEVYTVLSQRAGKKVAVHFGERIREERPFLVVGVVPSFEERAWRVFKQIENKNVSFVDCASFAVIKRLKIKRVLSFDIHFKRFEKKFGFKVLK